MAKEKNYIGEYLERVYPKNGKLQVDKTGNIHTTIVDAESDGFKCVFNNDGCVQIETDGYSYLTLDANTLIHLAKLIEKADKMYAERSEEEWDKYESATE